jgi:hypothetical protein
MTQPKVQIARSDTHLCPCGCKAQVPDKMYACKRGWFRLPKHIRDGIWGTYGLPSTDPVRRDALTTASEWYSDNSR